VAPSVALDGDGLRDPRTAAEALPAVGTVRSLWHAVRLVAGPERGRAARAQPGAGALERDDDEPLCAPVEGRHRGQAGRDTHEQGLP
jgi:hypothetical protein